MAHLLANNTRASILSSSGTLTVLTPPGLSRAILTTPTEGSDAPSEPDALDENSVKCAKYREFSSL